MNTVRERGGVPSPGVFLGDRMKRDMRIAALPVALLSILAGIAGIAFPEGGMAIRRLYFATPALFYAVVAVRSAMGLGLILAAASSRWPRALRALGAVVCLQEQEGSSGGVLYWLRAVLPVFLDCKGT